MLLTIVLKNFFFSAKLIVVNDAVRSKGEEEGLNSHLIYGLILLSKILRV